MEGNIKTIKHKRQNKGKYNLMKLVSLKNIDRHVSLAECC